MKLAENAQLKMKPLIRVVVTNKQQTVCQIIIIKANDRMDRLFGREISNLLEPNAHCKARYLGRVHSQSSRSTSEDPSKALKRFNRSSFGHNKSQRADKPQNTSASMAEQKPEARDTQMIGDYFEDCFRHMLRQEAQGCLMKGYMGEQVQINQKMRGILLDWLIDLHHKFKMFPQTLHAMVMIIDRYLMKRTATKENLQLVGTAALYIAAKYEETYQVPELDDLVHFAAKAFSKEQIIKMEADIIDCLDFNLIMETSYRFFQPMARTCKMETKNFHLAQYVLEMAMLDTKFLDYKPSLMASSAIYLINKIRKRAEAWPCELESLTGYCEKQLKNCARELCHLLERADEVPNNKSLKKKFSLPQYSQVTRIKLQRKRQ